MLSEPSPAEWPQPERPSPDRSPEETRATMSAIQRGWERGRSVFDPAGGNGEHTPEPAATAEASDATDARAAMKAVDAEAVDTSTAPPAGADEATDAGITADPAATWTDRGGATGGARPGTD